MINTRDNRGVANGVNLHHFQKAILAKLAFVPVARFNELLITGIESEHVNYHLKKLIDHGFIIKSGLGYSLSDQGKDYVNALDDSLVEVEKQPKVSVLIWGVRQNPLTGAVEHLLNRRMRQPYLGKVGRIGGKVQFGESLQQAAERELFEEAGLIASSFILEKIYHKLRYREDEIFVQDVIFCIFFVRYFSGELIMRTASGENFWFPVDDYKGVAELDVFDDFEIDDRLEPLSPLKFSESIELVTGC